MKTNVLVLLALFVGIGAILHTIVPPILLGVKPDMMLSMMFLGILFFPKAKYVLILGLATGVISALTTSAPGGQISNMVEKPITAFIFFALLLIVPKNINTKWSAPVLVAIGTIVSGSVFLYMALNVVGLLPGSFLPMFVGVVLPAALLNVIFILVIYPITKNIFDRSRVQLA
ncbi:hypothetical protein J2T56_002908 [Natronobacillus azotifigens]|uniref:Tryptophan transporter n=1 Tax=Natronobacillus azotifigens TaxID=472978 RepID=A0A9J6RDB9_9BACI|nr:tryptophan transporter [Natronobacillus azotifigens]MCZ0703308.1 tryptophan transporter [Natronobacillus azotifigens]